ncbi:hypothetical protein [Staphylococcus felis]|uniref:Uncharacterized protein n=1 Tax=Staphylococcus felis TaxID=46127 RepID=A0A3E0IKK1_9STAP|nr:hypothetical protein [Staphylococcus felis]REH88588.1 hypothetical protein DOS83_14110 [Staphylococcus felis]
MNTFKIIIRGLIENNISFETEGHVLKVEDCIVAIGANGVYYVRLVGIDSVQGLAVESPFAVLNFLIAYSRLIKDNRNI